MVNISSRQIWLPGDYRSTPMPIDVHSRQTRAFMYYQHYSDSSRNLSTARTMIFLKFTTCLLHTNLPRVIVFRRRLETAHKRRPQHSVAAVTCQQDNWYSLDVCSIRFLSRETICALLSRRRLIVLSTWFRIPMMARREIDT